MKKLLYISILLVFCTLGYSQPVPNVEENIPYLMTFGNESATDWGDDDFSQAFFSSFLKSMTNPFLSGFLIPIQEEK